MFKASQRTKIKPRHAGLKGQVISLEMPASRYCLGGLFTYNFRSKVASVWEPLPVGRSKVPRLGLQGEEAEHGCFQFALKTSSVSTLLSPGNKTPGERHLSEIRKPCLGVLLGSPPRNYGGTPGRRGMLTKVGSGSLV